MKNVDSMKIKVEKLIFFSLLGVVLFFSFSSSSVLSLKIAGADYSCTCDCKGGNDYCDGADDAISSTDGTGHWCGCDINDAGLKLNPQLRPNCDGGGVLACTYISGSYCGDGTKDSGEACDDGSNNGSCPKTCSTSCTINNCTPSTSQTNLRVIARATDGTSLHVDVGTCRGDGTTEFIKTGDERNKCTVDLVDADKSVTVNGVEYEFKRWKINGALQPPGDDSIEGVDLTSNVTALARFEKKVPAIPQTTLTVRCQLLDGTPLPGVHVTTCRGTDTTNFTQAGEPVADCSIDIKDVDINFGDNNEYRFDHWNIGGVDRNSGADPVSFGLNQDRVATAYYGPREVNLTVQARSKSGTPLAVDVKTCLQSDFKQTDFTVSGSPTDSCKVNLYNGDRSFDIYTFEKWKMGSFSFPIGDDPVFPKLNMDRTVTAIYDEEEEEETLTASLSALPNPVEVGEKTILTATVGGTAEGTINYTFYCKTSDQSPIYKLDGTNKNPHSTPGNQSCSYGEPGEYTAKVLVERGDSSTIATVPVTVEEEQDEASVDIWACDQDGSTDGSTDCVGKGVASGIKRVDSGDKVRLKWNTSGSIDGDTCEIDEESVPASGVKITPALSSNTTYKFSCKTDDGKVRNDKIGIRINDEPEISITGTRLENGCYDIDWYIDGYLPEQCVWSSEPSVIGWGPTEPSTKPFNYCPETTTIFKVVCNDGARAEATFKAIQSFIQEINPGGAFNIFEFFKNMMPAGFINKTFI